jgi:hypothetical protein
LFIVVKQQQERENAGREVREATALWRLMSKGEKASERHPPLVQVEPNIEEWPVFQLGRSKSNSAVVERIVQGEDGSSLRQRMEISAPGKYRLPGRFDYDVYSAVLELLEIRGGIPESGTLRFSLHELILLMDLEPSGRTLLTADSGDRVRERQCLLEQRGPAAYLGYLSALGRHV